MDTKDHILVGTTGTARPTTPMSSRGAHTPPKPRAATPPVTGSLDNRGTGARPLGRAG